MLQRVLMSLCLSVGFLSAFGISGCAAAETPERHVIVISIDGMRASSYVHPAPGVQIPNLERLMKEGSYASGVEGVYPTLTYPSHTTIVTGKMPAEHGIYTNLSSRQAGKNAKDWFWFTKDIKVPTLWDEARRAQLSTASISWPVTAGAAIDWNIPEIWDPSKGEVLDLPYLAKFMNPLFSLEMLGALGMPKSGAGGDAERVRIAVYLLKKHRPNLLLLHLGMLDEIEHLRGPDSPETTQTLERMDKHLGDVVAAVNEAGLGPSTDLFVVSDHGFLPITRDVAPNILLIRAGLLMANSAGQLTGGRVATVGNGGSFFIYWPEGENLRARVDAALRSLRDEQLVWAVIDRAGLKDLAADPKAQLALEAPEGVYLGNRAAGQVVNPIGTTAGTHGFLPFRPGLEASFIAWGPGIRAGRDLHLIPMTSIGPTILKALGIDDPHFGDQSPLVDIFQHAPSR
jgi:predicted AlkP superfamily pyrophosphatase or phosphodiesterase